MIILELSHGYASSQGYSCTATSQSSPARGSGQHGPSHGRDVYIYVSERGASGAWACGTRSREFEEKMTEKG